MLKPLKLGVAGTDMNDQQFGILNTLGGSAKAGQQAMDYARQLYPDVEEADPWEAAFQFFAEMGKAASVPGSTALSAGVSAMQAPMDYLTAKKKEKRETDRARMQTAVQLAPSLKAPKATGSGTSVQVVGPDGKPQFMSTAEAIRTNAEPYIAPKSGSASIVPKDYVVEAENGITIADVLYPKGTKLQLTDPQRAMFGPSDLASPTAASSSEPNSALLKLYKDLESVEAGSPQALALQAEIDAIVTKSGFDKELFDAENKIYTEYTKATASMVESQIAFNKLKQDADQGDGPGDLALVFSFMKMLDPGSVVRESEFAAAQDTAGLFQKLQVLAKKVDDGSLLSVEQRKGFLDLSQKFLDSGNAHMATIRRNKGLQVKNYGLNAANVFGYEPAPAAWYISDEAYNMADAAGVNVEAVWINKTPAEKEAWLAANGGS